MMTAGALSVGIALGASVDIQATVAADLRSVSGTIASTEALEFVDLQGWLPQPDDDLSLLRTFPGAPDRGATTWECAGPTCRFTAVLPRRYGDVGWTRRFGLRANGAWYPQPMVGGEPWAGEWTVQVTLPGRTIGVLNGAIGRDTLHWHGETDRLSLAVVPESTPRTVVRSEDRGVQFAGQRFVGAASARPVVVEAVLTVLGELGVAPGHDYLVVVDCPDRQRLATAGPGVVYLSDRAFRVSPGLGRFNQGAVRRAVAEALSPAPATWDRAFSATALTEGKPTASVDQALGWAAWNPIIDQLLHDGTLPFYDDIFGSAFPVSTDPMLRMQGRIAPRAAALQLRDLRGGDAVAALAGGDVLERATVSEPLLAEAWRRPSPSPGDVRAELLPEPRVTRSGTAREAVPVVIEVDGERSVWIPDSAEDSHALPAGTRRVRVDPDGHVRDADRSNNAAPARWSTVATGWVDDISPSQGSFTAWGDLVFRRQDDTRNLYLLGLQHDREDLVSGYVGYVRYLGPLLDRRAREHRIVVTLGPSWLDPAFRPTDEGTVAIGGTLAYAWDTRAGDTWAFSGHRYGASVGGGFVPGSDERWAGAGVGTVQLVPFHPRHVLALRARAGWASGDVEHRLLSLGGSDAVRAIDGAALLGNERLVQTVEYRAGLIHDASLPLGLAWLSEVQIVPGVEAGQLWRDGESAPVLAVGATVGVYTVIDVLGARPTLFGLSVAEPVFVFGLPDGAGEAPQVYLSFDHAF
jgi:hypothetical protein